VRDDEYRAKLWGWSIALVMGVIFFIMATATSGRGEEPKGPLLAGATVKIALKKGHGSATHIGKGRFLTANHVVEDEEELWVVSDRGHRVPAKVLWANKEFDIALVYADVGSEVRTSPLACRALRVGEDVHAKGNPLDIEFITTYGRVAGAARAYEAWKLVAFVDNTVGPGMSGGPTYDSSDNIVGVTVGMMLPTRGPMPPGIARTLMMVVPSTVVCDLLARS
jgi:S1-C subfamily serine protease